MELGQLDQSDQRSAARLAADSAAGTQPAGEASAAQDRSHVIIENSGKVRMCVCVYV